MSFAATSASIPLPIQSPAFGHGHGLDPHSQRVRPARLARKVIRTSLDLESNSSSATAQRRLPIGPRAKEGGKVSPTSSPLLRSLSTSQAHTRTPPPSPRTPRRSGTVRGPRERPPSLLAVTRARNDSAPAPAPVSVEKVKLEAEAEAGVREVRAQRRHGSIFLGPTDDTLRRLGHDSLSSAYTLEAVSVLSGDSDAANASFDTATTTKMNSGAASSSATTTTTKSASTLEKSSLPQHPQPKAGPSAHDSPPPPRRREAPAPLNLRGECNAGNNRLSFHPKFSFEDDEDDDEVHDSQPQPHLNVQRNPNPSANAKRRGRRRSRSASIILTPTYANSNNSNNLNNDNDNASFNSSPFPTPLTPSFRFEAPYIPEHREKRLNKLAWALGERVPASMVFPSLPGDSSVSASASGRRGLLTKKRERQESKNTMTRGAHNRTPTSGTIQALDLDGVTHTPRASVMMFPLAQPLLPKQKQKQKNARGSSHWKPPAEWEMGPTETTTSSSSSSSSTSTSMEMERGRMGPVRRRDIDEEVLGVWNADSFDDVLQRLRHLK